MLWLFIVYIGYTLYYLYLVLYFIVKLIFLIIFSIILIIFFMLYSLFPLKDYNPLEKGDKLERINVRSIEM